MEDFARALHFPIILVVGLKLGCLNHALLTVEAILSKGFKLYGWIANSPEEGMLHRDENVAYLKKQIDAPFLGLIPYQGGLDCLNSPHM